MMKVRRMLTEVLLEVTDSEVHGIAREVYNKSRSSASKGIAFKYVTSWCTQSPWLDLSSEVHPSIFNSIILNTLYRSYVFKGKLIVCFLSSADMGKNITTKAKLFQILIDFLILSILYCLCSFHVLIL